MKKQLLLGALLVGSFLTANAQNNCGGAVAVTPGTYTVGTIDGTYQAGCWQAAAATPAGEWYSFTATENALVRVNTNIAANTNPNLDTRVSVFTGTCSNLTCYAINDDVDAANEEYLSDLEFPAAAGVTYYIMFDNRWSALGFDFELSVTPTSCFTPAGFQYVEAPTTTTVSISWTAPAVGAPEGYQFEYGPLDYEQGNGAINTIDVMDGTEVNLTDLTASTDYSFYIRSFCGGTDYSEWIGPISFSTEFTAADLAYTYGFETPSLGGWSILNAATGSTWETMPAAGTAFTPQEGELAMSAGAFGAISDAWLFSRPLNLTGGEVVTVTYYVRERAGAGNGGVNNLRVTVGDDNTVAAQTTTIKPLAEIVNNEWIQETATFTAPSTGVYYIGFNYTAPAQAQANFGWVTLDNVQISSVAGVEENAVSQLAVFPNPATNVINIANASSSLVNGVSVVDINGRTVKTVKFDGVAEAQINVSDLASGMYIMNISTEKGTVTKKVVKN